MRAALAIAALLALSACDASSPVTAPSSPPLTSSMAPESDPPSSAPANDPGTGEVPEIWRFEAKRVGGGTVDGEQFVGKKVAVWLWAPWCGPCGRLAPEVAEAAREYEDITFLGVPGQDSDQAHEDFVDRYGLGSFTHAIDERRALWGHFGSATQEAWLFVDDDGTATARTRYGEMDPDLLRDFLDELRAA